MSNILIGISAQAELASTDPVKLEESRGHSIIASKLRDIQRREQEISKNVLNARKTDVANRVNDDNPDVFRRHGAEYVWSVIEQTIDANKDIASTDKLYSIVSSKLGKPVDQGVAEGMFTKGPAIDPIIGKQINNIINRLYIRAKQTKDEYLLGTVQELFDILRNTGGTYSAPGSPGVRDVAEGSAQTYTVLAWKNSTNDSPDVEERDIEAGHARAMAQELKAEGFKVVKIKKQGVAEGTEQSLSSMAGQDQAERNAYEAWVEAQPGATMGAEMGAKYAQLKNRSKYDLFGDAVRQDKFMKMKFDFDKFTDKDWKNYWTLAQHCDKNRDFQKNALSIIKKYQGTDHKNYKFLYDRISMGLTGKQKYGTQNGPGYTGEFN